MSDHIQIGDTSPRVQHVGDGTQTVFTYPFPIFNDTDLEVYVDGTLNILTTDYTVSNAGASSGGEVTLVSAPADQSAVTLVRRLTIQRTSDFQASGEFRAKVINDELDFQTASLQQIEDDLSRAIRLKRDDGAATLELPLAADRANKVIGFDADGNAQLSNLTLSEIETGATGPAGPTGPTGPQGNDGLFSGSEATVAPAADDLLAGTDTSDSDAAKFFSVENVAAFAGAQSNGGYEDDRFYGGAGYSIFRTETLTVTADRLYGYIFKCLEDVTFNRIAIDVTTAAASTNVRLGIYNWGGSPASRSLLVDCGTVSVGTTGTKEITISQALEKGKSYILAAVFEGTPAVRRATATPGYIESEYTGAASIGVNAGSAAFYASHTYGALPNPFGALTYLDTYNAGVMPVIAVRKV